MNAILLGFWIILNQQGQVMMQQGNGAGAVVQFRTAAALSEEALGADHPATAIILRNLSLAYTAEGFTKKAEVTAMRSLLILEKHFGPADVVLVPSLNALGESLAAQRRWTEARRAFESAVALGEPGAHGATALYNLATVFHVQNNREAARHLYQQALQRRESALGVEHPVTVMTRAALGKTARPKMQSAFSRR